MHNQSIVVLVNRQAAIKALIKCTVTSTVLNCIKNLNQLGEQNHVNIAWISGHAGVHGNEVADYVAQARSQKFAMGGLFGGSGGGAPSARKFCIVLQK